MSKVFNGKKNPQELIHHYKIGQKRVEANCVGNALRLKSVDDDFIGENYSRR